METLEKEPIRIMAAEDDDDDFLILTIALDQTLIKYKISRAEDGGELMKLLAMEIPELLLLDLHMPCKDGHQCLKEIRADKRYDSMPVVVYSSVSDEANIEKCYRAGSNFYVMKPGQINDLKLMLEQVLNIKWNKSLYYPPRSEFVVNPNRRIV